MTPIDFAGILLAGILAVPGQLVAAYLANPGPWNVVGLMLLGLALIVFLSRRIAR